jgi:hypothetical protein
VAGDHHGDRRLRDEWGEGGKGMKEGYTSGTIGTRKACGTLITSR